MNIPPAIYGALGGAIVTSVAWAIFAKPATKQPAVSSLQDDSGSSARPTVSALGDWSPQFPSGTRPSEVYPFADPRDGDTRPKGDLNKEQTPSHLLTREELAARASQVEKHANRQLELLALRLDLSEAQQDRIFPVLASASPGYHPSLQPEGMKTTRSTFHNGDPTFGDGTAINPGAPIADVENEIFPELDEKQQAILEEEAMDREAWWEDVVAFLEDDLENSTGPGAIASEKEDTAPVAPEPEFTDEEREAAAEGNAVDNFADLLFGG